MCCAGQPWGKTELPGLHGKKWVERPSCALGSGGGTLRNALLPCQLASSLCHTMKKGRYQARTAAAWHAARHQGNCWQKGADCSQGRSLAYDPFCFMWQAGSHYKYSTGKVGWFVGCFGVVLVFFFGVVLAFAGSSVAFVTSSLNMSLFSFVPLKLYT